VDGPLRSMTAAWIGLPSLHGEIEGERADLLGDSQAACRMEQWLRLSVFAPERRRVA
jgi:hypothetical protein